jgi:hypothetical protein
LEPLFVEQMRFSLQQVLTEGQRVTGDARVQPVLMGLQLALTALWRSYGVEPDAVIGHSMGEVTAAVVAGALTPDEGLRVIGIRSRLMSRLAGQGAVALLEMDAEATEKLLADYPKVTTTGYLSPRQTVVAGSVAQVDAVIIAVSAQDRFARRVNMEVASHTALMDPILAEGTDDPIYLHCRRRGRHPNPGCGVLDCQRAPAGAATPGHHRRCRAARHVRRNQSASHADPRRHRNAGISAPPQHWDVVAQGR